jgi:hypothetical protein
MGTALNTPVAFIIFNRPQTTEKVFKEIARAKPRKLLVIADGPRSNRPGEADKCRAARAVIEQVDWDCEVLTNYSDVNLGLKQRISSGINWVFETVEEAIILEDDCLPHPSFFQFCEELLAKYRNDTRVMMISGNNFLPTQSQSPQSYFFSHYIHIWGWASWRRAWQHYDVNMKSWPALRDTSMIHDALGDSTAAAYWRYTLDNVAMGYINMWSYQWMVTCWAQNGLSVTPGVNLVSNIGYGADATNLTQSEELGDNRPVFEMNFPLQHPTSMVRNRKADDFITKHIFKCLRWTNHGKYARISRRLFPWWPAVTIQDYVFGFRLIVGYFKQRLSKQRQPER